jgi:sugar phosphate isomerase/epimerase
MAINLEHIEFDASVFPDISNVLAILNTKQTAIHAPYFEDYGMDLSSANPDIDDLIENIARWKEKLNVIGVIVHPPLDAGGDLDRFHDRLEQIPFPLLENMPYQSWDEFLDFFNSTEANVSNALGMCFDIPHSYITNGESFLDLPEELLGLLSSKKGYIHISGGTRNEDTHFPLLTDGEIPFDSVKTFLHQIDFQGTVTMELSPRTFQDIDKILHSYALMLGIAGRRLHRISVKIKRPFIMYRINKLAKTNKL